MPAVGFDNRSEAYDLSVFEENEGLNMSASDKRTKKRKKSGKIISISRGSSAKAQRRKKNPVMIFSVALLTVIVAAVAITIVQFNAELNEVNDLIQQQNAKLTELENEEAQYRLTIDSKLTDDYVKNYAEKKLGMTPALNGQKKFISLSEGDKGEILSDENTATVFSAILDAFSGAFL